MNIDITGRNITVSSDLKELIYERVNKLLKYDKKIISAKVVLLKEARAEKIELIVTSDHHTYITKCYSSMFEKTFAKALSNIISQIKKIKSKH